MKRYTITIYNCSGCSKELMADWWEAPEGLCTDCWLAENPQTPLRGADEGDESEGQS